MKNIAIDIYDKQQVFQFPLGLAFGYVVVVLVDPKSLAVECLGKMPRSANSRSYKLLRYVKPAGVNLGALPLQCKTRSLIQALNMDTSAQ